MTLTRRPSPFGELVTLRQAMDRLFDDTVFRPSPGGNGYGDFARLPLDVRPTADAQVTPRQIRIQPVTADETIEPGVRPAKAQG